MTIPSRGALSAQTINFELVRSTTSTLSINTAENGEYVPINQASPLRPNPANPAAYSEWYGYDHNAGGGGFSKDLGFHPSDRDIACSDYFFGDLPIRFIDSTAWTSATGVWEDISFITVSPAGWYSDGTFNRFLSVNRGGAIFTSTVLCTL